MKFGILKSKIENVLIESYKNNKFKEELQNFKKYVLANKEVSKLYYLYESLSTNQGLEAEFAKDYIIESVNAIKATKIDDKNIKDIDNWLKNVVCENNYTDIDNLLGENVLNLAERIESRKTILESLTKKETPVQPHANIPLKSMIKVANQTLSKHINSLNESEQKEVIELLKLDNEAFTGAFSELQENISGKLNTLLESTTDFETQTKIKETIDRIKNESPDRIEYIRIKKLLNEI